MRELSRVAVYVESGPYRLDAEAVRIGADVLVYIWGGERPHIGAVAAAQPRPSLVQNERVSATASVLTYPGHKEDVVVKQASEALAAALETKVVVTAGIHWDNLKADDIQTVVLLSRQLVQELERRLNARSVDFNERAAIRHRQYSRP